MLEFLSVLALVGACCLIGLKVKSQHDAEELLMSDDELYERWVDQQW